MGTGSSKGPIVGVPPNPRVLYSDELSKREQKNMRIDAPVLVDIHHGSVRYREAGREVRSEKVTEIPYEGTDLGQKKHYFYHPRLKSFGPDADKSEEESFKFYYVTKGPARSQGKKLFYVYGQGWNAQDSLRIKPTQTVEKGKDYAWPSKRTPNDLFYNMKIIQQIPCENLPEDWEENQALEDLHSTADKFQLRMKVKSEERASSVKARLAVKLLKAAANIHLCYNSTELRSEDILGDLRSQEDRIQAILEVELTLI